MEDGEFESSLDYNSKTLSKKQNKRKQTKKNGDMTISQQIEIPICL
jgi:hypothetical protein